MTEANNDSTIERSTGDCVGGYRVGGGVRGKREDQDDAVKEFAARLADMFEHDITIRYNTDRLGGGAWLVDGERDAQVGLGAKLTPPEWHREQFQAYLDDDAEKPKRIKYMDPEDLNLAYTVNVKVPVVAPENANRDSPNNRRDYAFRTFDDLEAAWSWFEDHVRRQCVNPPA